jgi:hypothetical protein
LTSTEPRVLVSEGGRASTPTLAEPGAALKSTGSFPAVHRLPGNRQVLAAEILAGHRVSIRMQDTTLMIFDSDDHELLRARLTL